ncbi:putative arm-like repeat-containing protein [Coleophoma cylindrospora]|uniref:Putative arm-like repeat-containing protein n=1 Tax=Coleophoma cylindrospora TaxID=1849047 RepID=A0A3D8R5P5_9HELO|nr:putative arm-like repeat-containing protein [Coleophoma cylindrospora]
MGKSKPRNRNKSRADPVSKTVKPPSDPELAAIREKKILPCIQDLQSPDLKTRSAAASAITNIIEDTKCRKLLLREQIVRILLEQTLTDSSLETRTAGWGILRNLALEEEADFCIHLYRQDILTAIEGVVKSIIETIESTEHPVAKLPAAQQTLLWTLTGSIVNLLSSLAEAQEEITEAICKRSTIIDFQFGLLQIEIVPDEVDYEVLSCLAVLTEDNKVLVQQIVDTAEWLKKLMQMKDLGDIRAVAACGVLHNVFTTMQWFDHNTPHAGASDATLLPVLVDSMKLAQAQSNNSNGHSTLNPDQVLELALEITASIATSLQEALEHGNSFEKEFEGFEDKPEEVGDDMMIEEDGDEEEDKEESDDDEIDPEMEADMDRVTRDAPDDEDADDQPTLDRLVREAVPTIIISAQLLQHPTPEKEALQSHALAALNNIAWTVSSVDFSSGHLDSLERFWSSLAQRIWNEIITPVLASNTADIELASSITSLAWALARSRKGQLQIQPEEQRKFMALYQASRNLEETTKDEKSSADASPDAFQGLGVKCIGVLGRLALDPAPVELNREIGVFLLTILSGAPNAPAADVVEALNQIFDIYADKSYACDAVFWSDGFFAHLEEILPKARKLTKAIDKRKHEELRARADEVLLNLGRFLKYKKTEKSS